VRALPVTRTKPRCVTRVPELSFSHPLGTAIRSSLFTAGTGTATRGHRLRPSCAAADSGVQEGDHGPLVRPPEKVRLAGEKAWGSMIRALWCPGWTRLPFLPNRLDKYCHNGAWPSPTHHGVGFTRGPTPAVMAPSRGPQKRLLCRGKAVGVVRDSRPLGSGMDSSACRPRSRARMSLGGGESPRLPNAPARARNRRRHVEGAPSGNRHRDPKGLETRRQRGSA